MIKILMVLLLTGCASFPDCQNPRSDKEAKDCKEARDYNDHYHENGWRYDRFDRGRDAR